MESNSTTNGREEEAPSHHLDNDTHVGKRGSSQAEFIFCFTNADSAEEWGNCLFPQLGG
jgi:hypothetical protein